MLDILVGVIGVAIDAATGDWKAFDSGDHFVTLSPRGREHVVRSAPSQGGKERNPIRSPAYYHIMMRNGFPAFLLASVAIGCWDGSVPLEPSPVPALFAVRDADTGLPVPYAHVILGDARRSDPGTVVLVADEGGLVRAQAIPPGRFTLWAMMIGYRVHRSALDTRLALGGGMHVIELEQSDLESSCTMTIPAQP